LTTVPPTAADADTLTQGQIETDTTTPTPEQTQTATQTKTSTPTETQAQPETATQTQTSTPTETATETPTQTPTFDSPDQPKIAEITDNFGHTFRPTRDAGQQFQVNDEVVVSDDTQVEICVTEVAKQASDEVTYSYWFGNSKAEHTDNTAGDARIEDSCHTWNMRREDYSSHWGFSIWLRNEDDIYYYNDTTESDYRVVIHYNNLTLEE
jgi:hypothetical protein